MSKTRIKKCSSCGEEKVIVKGWSTRFPICQQCKWEQDRAKPKKGISNTPSKKLKSDREKDWEVGYQIWAERPHYCVECGAYLGVTLDSKSYLSHLLTKQSRPSLRHEAQNIVLHCPSCHDRWERGKNRHLTKTYREYLPTMIDMGFLPQDS